MFVRKRQLIVILFLSIASILVFKIEGLKGNVSTEIRLNKLPFQIGQWQGKDIEVTENVYQILETKDVLMREYKDEDGDVVILAMVYAGRNRDSLHPPEYCYLGGGAELTEKSKDNIPLNGGDVLSTNKLIIKFPNGSTKAWYWFATKGRFVSNYYLQELYNLWDALLGKDINSALIRVSVIGNKKGLEDKAKAFINEAVGPIKDVL
ncbi:MAG: EpsI family protein [Candidatus Omnitrophica bacterium]|nr:EpsI family protein [Candidatus Omnitrophota bacterium]